MCATRCLAVVGAIVVAACGRIGFDEGVTPEAADEARATIAVGELVSCAIRDGDVYCWGSGEEGQLGPDGTAIALRPVRITGIPKATEIAAARYHACIVSDAREVWCWGGNEYGRLGTMPPQPFIAQPGGPRTDPLHVTLPGPAIDVSVSNDSSCAVLATGAVWCWGRDNDGQLGRGTIGTDAGVNLPAVVMNISNARRLSLDDDSACALRSDGTIACWGENGRGLIDDSEMARVVPTSVAGFAGATAIALGGDHVCAIIGGRVGCRGANEAGELGIGTSEDSTEVVFTSIDDAIAIESGFHHVCAIRATGGASCWGWNDYYVLGDGTFMDHEVPNAVVGIDDAIAISTDQYSTCALRTSGAETCWGYGARGMIGDGRSAETSARMVMTLANAGLVAVGRDHSCVSDTTDVACWGANKHGQLGTGGSREPTATPQVLSFNWPFGITQLVAGEAFTCAVLADNSVYCWGANNEGQLGLGNFDEQMTPVRVPLPSTSSLAAGLEHLCAHATDSTVRCWGYNASGQVGNGTLVTQPTPVMVASGVDTLVAGEEHTCTLSGQQVACWGSNDAGEIGDNMQTPHTSPTPLAGVAATNLRAGGKSTCARRSSGAIACWGLNDSNVLLAPGGAYYQPTPIDSTQTQMFTFGGATACLDHACWGQNYVGQVGAGDFGYYTQPTPIAGLPAGLAPTFAVSSSHACALAMGVTYCWGENASGEIGAGTTSTATFAATTVAFP